MDLNAIDIVGLMYQIREALVNGENKEEGWDNEDMREEEK